MSNLESNFGTITRNTNLEEQEDYEPKLTAGTPQTEEDYRELFELIFAKYSEKQYVGDNSTKMLINDHELGEKNIRVIVKADNQVIGTALAIAGGDKPLPLEESFGKELAEYLKTRNLPKEKIVEFSKLAILADKKYKDAHSYTSALLVKAATYQKAEDFFLVVNPNHVGFYKKALKLDVLVDTIKPLGLEMIDYDFFAAMHSKLNQVSIGNKNELVSALENNGFSRKRSRSSIHYLSLKLPRYAKH